MVECFILKTIQTVWKGWTSGGLLISSLYTRSVDVLPVCYPSLKSSTVERRARVSVLCWQKYSLLVLCSGSEGLTEKKSRTLASEKRGGKKPEANCAWGGQGLAGPQPLCCVLGLRRSCLLSQPRAGEERQFPVDVSTSICTRTCLMLVKLTPLLPSFK